MSDNIRFFFFFWFVTKSFQNSRKSNYINKYLTTRLYVWHLSVLSSVDKTWAGPRRAVKKGSVMKVLRVFSLNFFFFFFSDTISHCLFSRTILFVNNFRPPHWCSDVAHHIQPGLCRDQARKRRAPDNTGFSSLTHAAFVAHDRSSQYWQTELREYVIFSRDFTIGCCGTDEAVIKPHTFWWKFRQSSCGSKTRVHERAPDHRKFPVEMGVSIDFFFFLSLFSFFVLVLRLYCKR